MSQSISNRLHDLNYGGVLRALDALSNWRVALLLIVSLVTALFVLGLAGYMGLNMGMKAGSQAVMMTISGLGGFLAAVVWGTGFNAAGVLLHDQALEQEPRPVTDALIFGAICFGRAVALGLMLVVIVLAYGVVMALAYFACKLPGVGPILFTFVYPAFVVTTGVMLVAIMWLAVPLLLASLWDGLGVMEAIGTLVAVARERLVFTILLLVVLSLLTAFAASIVSGVLFSGFGIASAVAVSVMGSVGDVGGSLSGFSSWGDVMQVLNHGSGYMIAGAAGSMIVVAMAAALIAQITIKGITLVYLQAINGLDLAATQSNLAAGFEAARQKATDATNRAVAHAQNMQAQAQAQAQSMQAQARERSRAAGTPTGAVAMQSSCPKCQAPVTAQDVFCGGCGFKLKI